MQDEIERLVNAAHDLFDDYSIYEVIDLPRAAAVERMTEMYGPVDPERVEEYLAVLDRLRGWVG